MKIAIIGNGYVGKATKLLLQTFGMPPNFFGRANISKHLLIYDKVPKRSECSFEDILKGDLFFICVPTPMNTDGSCDLSCVESAVKELLSQGVCSSKIILRSTVPVGTCDKLKINFMPEFLTEKNWKRDTLSTNNWIIGLRNEKSQLRQTLSELIDSNVHFCLNAEAEMVKYTRNCFLATKVSFFNEINNFCEEKKVEYEQVKSLVLLDSRINKSHTSIPGPDGKKGFGGTCFPKDMHSLSFQMQNSKVFPSIIKAAVERNETIDRPEKDWNQDMGRAVSQKVDE